MNDLRKQFEELLNNEKSYFDFVIKECREKEVYLFGVNSRDVKITKDFLNNYSISIKNIIDNNSKNHGLVECGIKYISPNDIKINDDTSVIICAYRVNEIREQLILLGINNIYNIPRIGISCGGHEMLDSNIYKNEKNKLLFLYDILTDELSKTVLYNRIKVAVNGDFSVFNSSIIDGNYYKAGKYPMPNNEYWPEEIFELNNNEIFFDVGSADGDTIEMFINHVSGEFNKIYAFEPDIKNFQELFFKYNSDDNIILFNKGLSNTNQNLSFESNGLGSYFVDLKNKYSNKVSVAKVADLDGMKIKDEPTLVKMDIEGFEVKAILGMKKTIKQSSPKLSICLYHRPEHLWQVPLKIHSINPNYKLYLRQYTDSTDDLVFHSTI
tara:strand:+ start:49 stop:1194 length:1146 start_codon:yes stop_codon:yes gene_type:complete